MIGSLPRQPASRDMKPGSLANFSEIFAQPTGLVSNPRLRRFLKQWRSTSFQQLEATGFDFPRGEDWKYTDPKRFIRAGRFDGSLKSSRQSREELWRQAPAFLKGHELRLVFVDGELYPEASHLESDGQGIKVATFQDILSGRRPLKNDQLLKHLEFYEKSEDPFTLANNALFHNGTVISVEGKTETSRLQLVYLTTDPQGEAPRLTCPRNLIYLGPSAQSEIVEFYFSSSHSQHLSNVVSDVFLSPGAQLTLVRVQKDGAKAQHVSTVRAQLKRDSRLHVLQLSMGSALCRQNLRIELAGRGAYCEANSLTVSMGQQHTDHLTSIDHRSEHTQSRQLYKSILKDKSRVIFNGRIFIREGAQKSDARQLSQNLLLSPQAEVDTQPQLEIFADDVKATHGATVGQLNDDEIFYLQSRGLSKEQAVPLLAGAFAREVVLKVPVAQLRKSVENWLNEDLLSADGPLMAEFIEKKGKYLK